MTFQQKLNSIITKNNSILCIGLDPVMEKFPKNLQKEKHPFFEFNKGVIDATHDLVCCYKPNSAFYEAIGEKGIGELKKTCDYIKKNYPEIPIILDAKRGDIGSTNKAYAQFAFDYLGADAITLQPYVGIEALQPFFEYKDKGFFILCKTSNPGSGEFQDLVYKVLAENVAKKWNKNQNLFLVVGATYPKELKEIRQLAGDMTFLIPGIGAQGGDVQQTVKAGCNSKNAGIIINSSRGIIFAEDPKKEAEKLRSTINIYRV